MDKICFECDNEIDGHKFHFYGTYGGGASGGYATDGSKKAWSWRYEYGTNTVMTLLSEEIVIMDNPEGRNRSRLIRTF